MGTLLGKSQKYLNLESIKSGQGHTLAAQEGVMERKTIKVLSGVRNLRQQLFQELSQGEKSAPRKARLLAEL